MWFICLCRSWKRLYHQFQKRTASAFSEKYVTRFALVSMELNTDRSRSCFNVGFHNHMPTTSTSILSFYPKMKPEEWILWQWGQNRNIFEPDPDAALPSSSSGFTPAGAIHTNVNLRNSWNIMSDIEES